MIRTENESKIFQLGNVKLQAIPTANEVFKVEGSAQAGAYFANNIGDNTQEILEVLYLNNRNEVVYVQNLFAGDINSAIVSPYQIIQSAVLVNANNIIIGHNYPSNSIELSPSDTDIQVVKKLEKALKYAHINLLDSFVVNDGGFYSFAEHNILNK